ncbi:sugar phosphate isomerase/epimerase family protein [Priestia megaterium]|uniref:sugar phosphate isomerase/epimerase family protein n=1 Tax=Priestia megaterium TaxID=1404 RepID=UPI0036DDCB66
MVKTALQLYSLKEEAEKDFLGTVEKVAEMGYEGIEFAGFYNVSAIDLKKTMDKKHIKAAGSHTMFHLLQGEEINNVFRYNELLNNKYIICPSIPEELRRGEDDYKKIADLLNKIGSECRKNGFVFGYHNHDFEFEKLGNTTGLELLLNYTDPSLVNFELDCYWATFAEQNPVDLIEKYRDRVMSLHLKDISIEHGIKTSVEIGKGMLNLNDLVSVGHKYGLEWFIIEQEQFTRDTFESCLASLSFLNGVMSK